MKITLHTDNIELSGKIVKNVFTIIFLAGLLASGYKGFTQASLNYATSIDINTASFSGTSFSVAAQDIGPTGLAFNNNGTKLYIVGFSIGNVNEYTLSSAFDLNSASFTTSFSVTAQETGSGGIAFNSNGTKMYVVGFDGDAVHEYALSADFDLSTSGFTASFSVAPQDTAPQGLAFNNDGTKMYVVGSASGNVNEFNLSSNAFTETPANDGSVQGSIIVSISNETFTSAGGTLSSPDRFTINKLPSGLTPSISVGSDGLTATLTLTGNASNHDDADDVTDLQFTFTDAAFDGGNAAAVNNAINASSNLGIDFTLNVTTVSVIQADSLALVDLYNSTDGTLWDDNSNWLSGSVDSWYGITVQGDRVFSIDLVDNNLVGSIPASIGDLTGLDSLFIWSNDFFGTTIPVEIGNMTSLKSLDLFDTGIGGNLPASLGKPARST